MGFFEAKENEKQVDNSLFVERYRPTKLEDYVGNDHLKDTIGRLLKMKIFHIYCFMEKLVLVKQHWQNLLLTQ